MRLHRVYSKTLQLSPHAHYIHKLCRHRGRQHGLHSAMCVCLQAALHHYLMHVAPILRVLLCMTAAAPHSHIVHAAEKNLLPYKLTLGTPGLRATPHLSTPTAGDGLHAVPGFSDIITIEGNVPTRPGVQALTSIPDIEVRIASGPSVIC